MCILHAQLWAVWHSTSLLALVILIKMWVLHALLCESLCCRPLYMLVAVSTILGVYVLR